MTSANRNPDQILVKGNPIGAATKNSNAFLIYFRIRLGYATNTPSSLKSFCPSNILSDTVIASFDDSKNKSQMRNSHIAAPFSSAAARLVPVCLSNEKLFFEDFFESNGHT